MPTDLRTSGPDGPVTDRPDPDHDDVHIPQHPQRPRIQVGRDYLCPQCERLIPTRKQRLYAKPAKFAHVLNDIIRCPHCEFIFSPKADALAFSQ